MREKLTQYVVLLFEGAGSCEDIKQEILQNTLDRYDDLIAEGKSPESAYRLAISGIGDINEILGRTPQEAEIQRVPEKDDDNPVKKVLRAAAIFLYIISPIPLFILSEFAGLETIGLCGTIAVVAFATVLMVLGGKQGKKKKEAQELALAEPLTPQQELNKSVNTMIWAIGLALYFILSFATGAWHVTWVIFPMIKAVQGLAGTLLGNDSKAAFQKSISSLIWAVGLALYFILSFTTGAWHITWVLFPVICAMGERVRILLPSLRSPQVGWYSPSVWMRMANTVIKRPRATKASGSRCR